MQKIGNHAAIVVPLVLSQYQKAPRMLGLIKAGCAQADDVEEALYQIREGLKLDNAVGPQLDILGKIYRETRDGRSDADYREAIRVRASLSVNGNPEEILAFLRFSMGATDAVYYPEYPAGYVILTNDETFGVGSGVLDVVSPAGVQGLFGSPMLDALDAPMLDGHGTPMYGVRA